MPKILIFGGTGMLGRPVTHRLLDDGFAVRLFTSHPDKARQIFGETVEYAQGDVADIQSIRHAMPGCEAVYINLKGGPTRESYVRIEQGGPKNIYAAAKDTGVRKIVQIGGANYDQKNAAHFLARVKVEAEKALMASGITYVILKPSWFCESLPLSIKADKAIFVGSGKRSFHFLTSADYAEIVSKCFSGSLADNKRLTIFGPEPMPIPEAMRRFLTIAHPDVRLNHLSLWMARLAAAVSFNTGLKAAVTLMAFYDRHDDADVEIGPEEADRLFGRCPTTVEEWATVYRKVIGG